ncbi:VTT domain-containing protein [bacterium]|nr:VTT domain-containing protein [bacterium]
MFGIDLISLTTSAGYAGIFAIVFIESGLLIGFFLPGDSLLFTAGLLASSGILNISILVPLIFIAAVLGDNMGYYIGKRAGEKLLEHEDTFFFRKSHAERTRAFYEKHGPKAIVLARFIPIVRTFAPVFAGVGSMKYRTFFFYNVLGGFLWAFGVTLAGYFLGGFIPDIDKYLLPIIGVIILISFLPFITQWLQYMKDKREKKT